jgi:hypothetical protein
MSNGPMTEEDTEMNVILIYEDAGRRLHAAGVRCEEL